ncbi:MAG: glycosyltransferase family 2 protein [Gemmataceae bacterium]|nr:glycosyltransferase family 2 protein [Gemmataceae bacterium]
MAAPPVPLAPAAPRASRQPARTTEPRLSVVIVNYCQWENTEALVRQVSAGEPGRLGEVEVVVVDNHSPPHRLARRLRRREGVSLRRWGRNRGFARAVNEGCRLSRGSWFLLLNPDVTLSPGVIEGALAVADELTESDPRAGIVGFQLRHEDGSRQHSCGSFPTLAGTLAGLALPRARRKYRLVSGRTRCRVPWVTGCALLLRRDCLLDLGGLDERFFLYYEDVDLCRRAWQRGWSVWYEPRLRVVHHQPLHLRRVSPLLRLATRHALLTYALRHWPRWQQRLLAGVVRLEAWGRRLWARWRGRPKEVQLFADLGALAGQLARGDERGARRRLDRRVREEETRREDALGRHPQSQPPRPAGRVPRQRAASCASGD